METAFKQLIKTGIAADYPVNWKFESVLRDLIQNFFDSIGRERFQDEFDYSWQWIDGPSEQASGLKMTMRTAGHPFHYGWLVCLGGSTKTELPGKYIGQYGEGFKICMLCLLKEGIQVSMHSQNWQLSPCWYDEIIDHRCVRMLGYHYSLVEDDGITELKLTGIKGRHERVLKEGLMHFFYEGNPLLGEKLYEAEDGTICRGSGISVPTSGGPEVHGILYVNHLARGRLPFPLFINVNCVDPTNSRKREDLYPYDILKIIYQLVRTLPADTSLQMLEMLGDFWRIVPETKKDCCSWYFVICQLVRNVSSSEKEKVLFQEKYPALVYLERKGADRIRNKIIEQTGRWVRDNNVRRLVNPVFRLLGAVSLVEQFVQNEEQNLKKPDSQQQKIIDLLFSVSLQILPILKTEKRPTVLIGSYDESRKDPLRFAEKATGRKSRLPYQRYHLNKMVLSEEDFRQEAFCKTLVFFGDTLLHIFGSSSSERMNGFTTRFAVCLIDHAQMLQQAREKWLDLTEDKEERIDSA